MASRKRTKSKPVIVVTTTPTRSLARKIGKRLLDAKLIAAIQIHGPLESSYWWKQKIMHASEWACSLRTTARNFTAIEKIIRQEHSYEIPEIFAYEITKGHSPYLNWIDENCR